MRVWGRVLAWSALLAVVIAWRLIPPGSTAAGVEGNDVVRVATPAEWALPIAELGRQQLAKRLVVLPLARAGMPPLPRGWLVWWHDADGERLSYLGADGERGDGALRLGAALRDGGLQLYDLHGDPTLRERLLDLPIHVELPVGWTVLEHPEAE